MQTDKSVERPLHSLRVIEFEGIGPGPLAGRMLSDVGAHVTVVARPTMSPADGDPEYSILARFDKLARHASPEWLASNPYRTTDAANC